MLESEPKPSHRLSLRLQSKDQLSWGIETLRQELGILTPSLLFSRSATQGSGRNDLGDVPLEFLRGPSLVLIGSWTTERHGHSPILALTPPRCHLCCHTLAVRVAGCDGEDGPTQELTRCPVWP